MNRHERQLQTILGGRSDANIRFSEIQTLMYKYEIILYWSNEDSTYIAEVPELQGCIAHGDSQINALKNVNAAVQLWIDTAREFGDPVPEPKGERLMNA